MKIAICDDDKGSVRSLKNIIMEIADRGRREVEIQSYFAVDEFEKAVRGGAHYDLIYMDIEFPEIDGFQAADFLRNEMKNQEVFLIFVSGREVYYKRAFEFEPFRFYTKPFTQEIIERDLEIIHERLLNKSAIEYVEDGLKRSCKSGEVLYFKAEDKKVCAKTVMGEKLRVPMTITKIGERYKEQNFFVCHQSYVVNLRYVKRVLKNSIVLTNEEEIPIARARMTAFKEIWFQCLKG